VDGESRSNQSGGALSNCRDQICKRFVVCIINVLIIIYLQVGYTTIVKVLKVGEVVEEDSHSEPELNSSGIDAEDGPSSDSDDAEVAEVDEIGETQLTKRKKVVIVSDNEDPEDHSAPALVQTPKSKKRDVSKKVALSTRVRTPKIKKEYQ